MADPKKRKKRRIIILSVLGCFIVLLLVSIEVTSHSSFCSTCHYMKPFYRSWQSSSHSKVACSTCHYPPGIRSKFRAKIEGLMQVGRYWTKLYLKSKPWAEIPDESCLRHGCHDKRLLEGQVKYRKVVFDHKIHLTDLKRGKTLRCTSCHSQIVQGEHITITASTCFICHFKQSEHYPRISDCSHCHQKDDLVSEKTSRFNHASVFDNGWSCDKCHTDTVIGDGAVPRENCYKCHWETERLEKYSDTDLMHATHITAHKIECSQCHMEIQHKIVKNIEAIADCKSCHTGFHQEQNILYTGEGGKGTDHPMPNIMLEKGLSCKGCHIFHEETGGRLVKSSTLTARAASCESCHGKGFSRILRNWEAAAEKKLGEVSRIYERAAAEIQISRNPKKAEARQALDEAAFNIDIVRRGKSVHNMAYSQELLSASLRKIGEALQTAGSAYKPEPVALQPEQLPSQCAACHAGIEEINTSIFGMIFPHKSHLVARKIECAICHSNARKHGEFIATKQSCATCHHKDAQKDCGSCHSLQKTLFDGGALLEGVDVPKDTMSEAKVSCTDCHQDEKGKVVRPLPAKCADCHEESYAKTREEWQGTTKNLLNSLRAALAKMKSLALSEEEKSEIQRAEQLLQKIESDGSAGVHNFVFIEDVLTSLLKKVK